MPSGVVLGDDLVPRLSLTTARGSVQDLREALLRINDPQAHELPLERSTAALQTMVARGNEDDMGRLAAAHTLVATLSRHESPRLFPAGRLVVLRKALTEQDPVYVPLEGSQSDMDELLISSDMASAHMPARYLKALDEAMSTPAPSLVRLSGLG
ncbi:unnamed protein product [Effrenium voratum]|uniref:Uncharacterized protein n=1 Tax=Effrenium voratum TaxID=2562239 RepID=A0AA36J968_9DINO|nr:unnamed protein product [Effrenium voratum]